MAAMAFASLAGSLWLRMRLVGTLGLNWDEYGFLHTVYRVTRGEAVSALQSFHGRLFGWLTWLPSNEVEQILAGRWVMFGLAIVSAVLVSLIGRRLLGGSAGLFAAFVGSCFWYVLQHGAAFRFDGVIVTLFLGSVSLLIWFEERRRAAALAGVLIGLSLLVSIKTSLYLPSLLLILLAPLLGGMPVRRVLERMLAFAVAAAATGVGLYLWHSRTLAPVETTPVGRASAAYQKMLQAGLLPRKEILKASFAWEYQLWLLLALGLCLVLVGLVKRRGRERAALLGVVALAAPLAFVAVYRNAWPYFYVSVLPGAALLAGGVWRFLENAASRLRPALVLVAAVSLSGLVAESAWSWFDGNRKDELSVHRDIVNAVHEMFPEPVPYLDRCGMIASFPKKGWFMSTWGMETYRAREENVLEQVLRQDRPVFMINNTRPFNLSLQWSDGPRRLTAVDDAALRASFIPHWGPVWVAGKTVQVAPGEEVSFPLLIGGRYTLESAAPVEVDGRLARPGDVLELEEGTHTVRVSGEESREVTFRIGEHLTRPERAPPSSRVSFRTFRRTLQK